MEKKINSIVKKLKKLGYQIKPKSSLNDPVCGMDSAMEELKSEFDGKTYHFCSKECKHSFELNPNNYA